MIMGLQTVLTVLRRFQWLLSISTWDFWQALSCMTSTATNTIFVGNLLYILSKKNSLSLRQCFYFYFNRRTIFLYFSVLLTFGLRLFCSILFYHLNRCLFSCPLTFLKTSTRVTQSGTKNIFSVIIWVTLHHYCVKSAETKILILH